MDRLLGRAAVALAAALGLVFVGTIAIVAWPRTSIGAGQSSRAGTAPYRAGATIDTPADWHESSQYTLMLFARSSCAACQEAAPFLRELIHTTTEKGAVVLVTSRVEHELDVEYAKQLGVDPSAIRQAVPGLRVRVTPTLVLVDHQGTILEAWEGVGSEATQAEIRRAILRVISS